jgi:hypothetical protein
MPPLLLMAAAILDSEIVSIGDAMTGRDKLILLDSSTDMSIWLRDVMSEYCGFSNTSS